MHDSPSPAVARFVAVVVLISLCLSSIWFEVNAKGTYIEGIEREPTLWANYTIDGEVEEIELAITNATPLISYWANREIIDNSSSQSTGEGGAQGSENEAHESTDGDSESALEGARKWVKLLALALCFAELFVLLKPSRLGNLLCNGCWLVTLLALLVLVPIAAIGGFGGEGEDDSTEPAEGFDTGEESGDSQFVHNEFESDWEVSLRGITWSFESSGYDLGLVNESDRESVRTSEPQAGEAGADAMIRLAGEVRLLTSTGVIFLLSVPIVWLSGFVIGKIVSRQD